MSGSLAKDMRRDLRRAFGDQALDVIERQGQAIEALATQLDAQRAQTVFLTKALAEIKAKFAMFCGLSH